MRGALEPEIKLAADRRRIHPLVPLFTPMPKPKNMTPDEEAAWRLRDKQWRDNNRLQLNQKNRERYAKNPESFKNRNKRSYQNNREKRDAETAARQKANPEKVAEYHRRIRDNVTDAYLARVKQMPVDHLRQYPRPVIDLWKTLLKLSRIQKQIHTEINEIENDKH